VNGDIALADFSGSEVQLMAGLDEMTSGLFVQIDRINSNNFPTVALEVSVRDRTGQPIVGLDHNNFVLTENKPAGGEPVQAANQDLTGTSDLSKAWAVSILTERSLASAEKRDALSDAYTDIAAAVKSGGGSLTSIVSAGRIPVYDDFDINNPLSLQNAAKNASFSSQWHFDLGLRLAAGSLLAGPKKRAVFYLCTGSLGAEASSESTSTAPQAFDKYGMAELAAYMKNNGVIFNAVLLDQTETADANIQYLVRATGGSIAQLYSPKGIEADVRTVAQQPSGVYFFTYTSSLNGENGEAFLPVTAEAYYLERSGRDTAGYFSPAK
jgi:hypothetical protein